MGQDLNRGRRRRAAAGSAAGEPQPAPPAESAAQQPAVPAGVTPSMAQFLEIKAANPDCMLFYRMGDFYELFFEDAIAAAQALGIVLTKRGKHLGQDIPMCGVPVHRADEYLQRLIASGFRVAVCEQLEDPAEARKRGHKAVVRRDVVRLVTPGTLTEDSLLDAKARNYLTALFKGPDVKGPGRGRELATIALASLDISTGEFEVGEIGASDFPGEIVRLSPGEVIAADATLADGELKKWLEIAGAAATPVPAAHFDSLAGERLLKARLKVADLSAFGQFSRGELAAVGALLKYVELTQLGKQPSLRPPRRSGPSAHLLIDAPTRASLELLRSTSGERRTSLLAAIDRTVTGAGARELATRVASPSREIAVILARHDAVQFLLDHETMREDVRAALRAAPDMARAMARLALQRGSPRDLAAVRDALTAAHACGARISHEDSGIGLPAALGEVARALATCGVGLARDLARAIVDDPPHLRRDGGFVRAGFSRELDEVRALREDSRKVMAELEARYVNQTGLKALKVRHNNILGYYIEVPAGAAKPLLTEPLSNTFRHRQTMAGAVRFTTPELVDTESRIVSAADRALALEQEIFAGLAAAIAADEAALSEGAAALARLDCEAGLAEVAVEQGYTRPVLDDGTAFEIRGGRHPVVEQALRAANGGAFIDNDCVLVRAEPDNETPGFDEATDARLWLVTGPNMAGKSTFLRQNALITVLAQMGSFVPARSAHIGIVDRLFSRVGAADDLARGRSTFMVEMVETAGILNQATPRSLVILDEIGRGTATFDGLSIAWAVVEYLHEVSKCRALFATHYHELTALAGRLPQVANVTIEVREWKDDIVFLHKVKPGAADRSYGIQVAKLAGLPRSVTKRAGEVLKLLEKPDRKARDPSAMIEELPLFAASSRDNAEGQPHGAQTPSPRLRGEGGGEGQPQDETYRLATAILDALAALHPDELTPKAALEALYRLKELSSKPRT